MVVGAEASNLTVFDTLCLDFAARREEIEQRLGAAISDSEESVLIIGGCVTEVLEGSRGANEAARLAMDSSGGDSPVMQLVDRQRGTTEKFLGDILGQLQAQQQRADSARAKSSEIVGIATEIAHIANTTKFLSLNARIEATRLGEAGRAFAVLADEMVDLARSVRAANDRVAELAETLAEEMPLLASGSEQLVTDSQAFGDVFREHVKALTAAEAVVSAQERLAMEENERGADANLAMAQKALSHLQFQDPMAQSLSRVGRLVEDFESLLGSVSTDTGDRAYLAAVHPLPEESPQDESSDEELDEDQVDAGEVMLF